MPPQPTQYDVHANRPLTNLSVAYMSDGRGFVADRVFPFVNVMHQSDTYYVFDRASINRNMVKKRADNTEPPTMRYTLSTDSYNCHVWTLADVIGKQRQANQDPGLDAKSDGTEILMHQHRLNLEIEWASTYFTGGVWTTDLDGGTDFTRWDDPTSDPVEDFLTQSTVVKKAGGFRPNKAVIGAEVWDKLRVNPAIEDRLKYGQAPGSRTKLSLESFADMINVDEVLIMDEIKNTAQLGDAESNSFIGGKAALLTYAAPRPGLKQPSAGYTFTWSGYMGGVSRIGTGVDSFFDRKTRSWWVVADAAWGLKLTSADLGCFFDLAVS